MDNILDGRQLAKDIRAELAQEVIKIKEKGGKIPHLAAILVGDDPASQVYVRNKVRSCEKIGFNSTLVRKAADATEEEVLAARK
jgi:methylenetetrahydrofolate dehydrogenase (NADP+)/methenyltetrahydrofolate cyclohydrolase